MTASQRLHVRVNEELVLDAGTCETVEDPRETSGSLRNPETLVRRGALKYDLGDGEEEPG